VLVALLAAAAACGAPSRDAHATAAPGHAAAPSAHGGAHAGPGVRPAAPAVAARPAVTAQHAGTTLQGVFAYEWTSDPDPIPFNERFSLTVTVASAERPDEPLPGATLEANALMPEHGHGMNTAPRVTRVADGTFRVDGMLFHMPGLWHLVLVVKDAGRYDSAIVPIALE
jgi:hypothetical protein